MCNQTSFEKLLDFGFSPDVMDLDYPSLETNRINPEAWTQFGMLKKRPIDNMVRCRYCDTFVPVNATETKNGIILRADCYECGRYDLFPEETVVWRVDYTPVFESARKSLNCSGEITEILPHILWSLGRAPIGGQSREIFACAGINSYYNDEIMKHLPDGKTPILLIFGDKVFPHKLGNFSSDRVFKFSHLTRIQDGAIFFDASHIHAQIATLATLEEPPAKVHGRNSKIGDIAIKLKTELRQFMCGIYSAMEQAERSGKDYHFNGIKQNELAAAIGATPVIVNRALKKDMELKALFDAANNSQTAYNYGRKAMR